MFILCHESNLIFRKFHCLLHLGRDVRKPSFGGLRTTKAHKVSYIDLLRAKFQFSS